MPFRLSCLLVMGLDGFVPLQATERPNTAAIARTSWLALFPLGMIKQAMLRSPTNRNGYLLV